MDFRTEGGNNVTIQLGEKKEEQSNFRKIAIGLSIFIGAIILLKIIGACLVYRKTRIQQKHYIELSGKYGGIYILLYNHNNSDATAKTILSAIRKAYSTKNIYVGVYQELSFDSKEYDVYDLLIHYSESTIEVEWIKNNLSVISVDNTTVGKFWAYKELIKRNIFSDINYVLLTNPGIAFDSNWDKYFLESFLSLEKTSPEPPILTSFLSKNNKPQLQENKIGEYGVLQFMHSVVGDSRAILDSTNRQYYFPYVDKFKGVIPIFTTRKFSQKPEEFIEISSISSNCTFMNFKSLQDLISLPFFNMQIASYAEDTLLSAMLWMDDHTFYTLLPKMFIQKSNVSIRPHDWNSKDIQEILLKDYKEYFTFLGVDLKKRQISGRALLGILPEESMDDIIKKYGSFAEYDRVKRYLGIQ